MPDLQRIAGLAKESPQSYVDEVLIQRQSFDARIELFQMNPQNDDENTVQLLQFMCHMTLIYKKELSDIPLKVLNLLFQFYQQMHPDFRIVVFKSFCLLVNNNILQFDPEMAQKVFLLLQLHDKPLRASVQAFLMKQLQKHSNNSQILQPFCNSINSSSTNILVKFKLLQILSELYLINVFKSQQALEKVVNLFSDSLVNSPDKRIINFCIHFLLSEEFNEDDQESDGEGEGSDPDDPLKKDELNKLYLELRQITSAFKTDEVARKKKQESLRAQIRKIKYGHEIREMQKSKCLVFDYLRNSQQFADQLVAKFLARKCPLVIRFQIFDLLSQLMEADTLFVPLFYSHLIKYLRPKQEDVTKLLTYFVRSIHIDCPQDEVFQTFHHIVLEFMNAACDDDEMTVGLNAIAEAAKRAPHVLLAEQDGIDMLNELLSLSRQSGVQDAKEKSSKTSVKGRRGVVSASRNLLNFYREAAPQVLSKKYLDKDSAGYLSHLKEIDADKVTLDKYHFLRKPISRIQNIELLEKNGDLQDDESSSEEDVQLSKHSIEKQRETRRRVSRKLQTHLRDGKKIDENFRSQILEVLGRNVDENGNEITEVAEESFAGEGEEFFEMDEGESESEEQEVKLIQVQKEDHESIPLEQRELLTQEQLEILKSARNAPEFNSRYNDINLEQFIRNKKMTHEEKMKIMKDGQEDRTTRKSAFWNRKSDLKSRTNSEKELNKPMLMVVHSRKVAAKAARSKKEKLKSEKRHNAKMKGQLKYVKK